jgi:tungstate transport system ATP-binding protein
VAQTILSLRQIVVSYAGRVALNIDSLEIKNGELLALMGPNGAGKSTLLRVMGLLQRPDAGKVQFHGTVADAQSALALRPRIATVFQEPLLLNDTLYQNAALGLRMRGMERDEIAKRLEPWLERLRITDLSTRAARTLSSGEAQRTSLARALVLEPELLLLDEPFGALDASGRESLLRDFQRIVKDTGITSVLVTHDRDEAFLLADRIAVLTDGRMLQTGAKDEVFARPATEKVASIVGIENRLRGRVEEANKDSSRVRIGDAFVIVPAKIPVGTTLLLCMRAEDLSLSRADTRPNGVRRLRGTVAEITPGLHQLRCTVACAGFDLIVALAPQACSGGALRNGIVVNVCFDPANVHVIPADVSP